MDRLRGNRHKIHKNHSDLDLSCFLHCGESELSAFSAQSDLENAENVESSRSEDCRNLSFEPFAPFVSQKAQKVQNPYSKDMNYQHFRHDWGAIMLIMSIVHNWVNVVIQKSSNVFLFEQIYIKPVY